MITDNWADDPDFRALVADYVKSLERRRELILSHAQGLSSKSGDALTEALQGIRTIAHNLSGTGESYGFPAISKVAGALDDLLTFRTAGIRVDDLEEYSGLLAETLRRTHTDGKDAGEMLEDPRVQKLLAVAETVRPGP